MADKVDQIVRDRLRILAALLSASFLGLGAKTSRAGAVTKKKAAKKKTAKKKVAKKKVAKKTATRVPEPGTVALLTAGAVAAGGIRKLRSRKRGNSSQS